jgi:two-component system, OmpR family, KDP operon response regulator KdpE
VTQTRILVVDDEPKLVRLVHEILTAVNYQVIAACNGTNAVESVATEQPDLMLLDLILPGEMDGYEVARRVREFSDIPIIMLTAKVREADILRGFEMGADDYITKPFGAKELLARIRAVLKRAKGEVIAPADSEIEYGSLKIDLARRRVTLDGRLIRLTPTEYSLLHELAMHCDQVMLHGQLLAAVWGSEYRDDIDYLRAYIHYLRQKLEPDPSNPRIILSTPGVGYMLACPDKVGDVHRAGDNRLPIS